MLSAVKDILKKEVDVKEFLDMEIELTNLKEILATEVKLKEFLVQEIDLKNLLANDSSTKLESEPQKNEADEENSAAEQSKVTLSPIIKKQLPAYDYSLIENLRKENKEVRFIFDELMRFAEAKEYSKVAGRLETFNSQIRNHYQKADTELYAYLKTYIHIKYPKREKAFTQLSLEMKNISIEIFYTISQSPNIPLNDKTHSAFMKEFTRLGDLLDERTEREESVLFKMYEDTHTAKSIC